MSIERIYQDLSPMVGVVEQISDLLKSVASTLAEVGSSVVETISNILIQISNVMQRIDENVPDFGQITPKLGVMALAIGGMAVVTGATTYFSDAMIEGLVIVERLSNQMLSLAEALKVVDETVPNFGQIAPKLGVMALAISGMMTVTGVATYFSDAMIEGLVIVERLSNQLLSLAQTLKSIDETVPDFGQIGPKLGVMALAIGGIMAVTGAATYFSDAMVEGLVIVEQLSNQLLSLAETLKEIDGTVPDFGQIAPRLGIMAVAIGGIMAVTVAASYFSDAMAEGLGIVGRLSHQILSLAEALKEIDGTVPNFGQIAPKLLVMGLAIGGMMAVTGAAAYFSDAMLEGLGVVERLSNQMLSLAEALKAIDESVPNFGQIAPKLLVMGLAIGGMMAVTGAAAYFSDAMIEGLVIVEQLSNQMLSLAEALKAIDESVPDFGQIAPKLLVMGLAIGGMMAVTGVAAYFSDAMIEGLVVVEALSNQLLLLAEILKTIDETVPDFGQIAPKLGIMALAIGGMAVVTAVAGKFSKAMFVGLEIVSELSNQLIRTAEALKLVDKHVPDNLASIVGKLAIMGVALLAMGAFVAVVGLIAKSGIGAAVLVLGSIVTAGLAATIVKAAEAIGTIIANVPSDITQVGAKIEVLSEAMRMVASQAATSAIGLLRNFMGMLNVAILAAIINMYAEIAETLVELQNLSINKESVMERIDIIAETLKAVAGNNIETGMSLLETFRSAIKVAILGAVVMMYAEIGKSIQKINDLTFDPNRVMEQIGIIKDTIDAVRSDEVVSRMDLLNQAMAAVEVSIIGEAINTYAEIAETLQKLSEMDFTEEDRVRAMEMIDFLQEFVGDLEIGSSSLVGRMARWFSNAPDNTEIIAAREHIENLEAIAVALETIQGIEIDQTGIGTKLEEIQNAIEKVTNFTFPEGASVNTSLVQDATDAIENFAKIAEAIKTIQEVEIAQGVVIERIEKMQATFSYLGEVDLDDTIDVNVVAQARDAIESFAKIAQAIETIQKIEIVTEEVISKIGEMQDTFEYLKTVEEIDTEIDVETIEAARTAIGYLAEIAEAIQTIQKIVIDPGLIEQKLTELQNTFEHLNTVDDIVDGAEIDTSTSQAARDVMGHLVEIGESIQTIQSIKINPELVGKQIAKIQKTFEHLTSEKLGIEPDALVSAEETAQVKTAMSHLAEIAESIKKVTEATIDSDAFSNQITNIRKILTELEIFASETTAIELTAIEQTISNFQSLLTQLTNISTLFDGIDIVGQLASNIEVSVPRVEAAVTSTSQTIKETFRSGLSDFDAIGRHAMDGLNRGLQNGEAAVMAHATRIANNITRTMRNALAINSPSRIMREKIGRFIPEGVAAGIDKYSDTAVDSAYELGDDLKGVDLAEEMMKLGEYTMEGFAIGMENEKESIEDVTEATADTVKSEFAEASKMQQKLQSITAKLANTKQHFANQAASMMQAGVDQALAMGESLYKTLMSNQLDHELQLAVTPPDADNQAGLMERLIYAVEAGRNIIMDTGELVGATYAGYDAAAGGTISYNSRWGR